MRAVLDLLNRQNIRRLAEAGGGFNSLFWNLHSYFSILALLSCILFLNSCSSPSYLPESELQAYIKEESNGLIKKRTIDPFKFTVQYRPNDLVILQEVGDDLEPEKIAAAANNFEKYAYFILNLEVDGGSALYKSSQDMAIFSERLQTLAFGMSERVSLITSESDTIRVADYVFDRTFGMGSTMLMFVFNNEKLADTDWFTFNLKEFGFRTGDQKFRFETSDLTAVPRLEELRAWFADRQKEEEISTPDQL